MPRSPPAIESANKPAGDSPSYRTLPGFVRLTGEQTVGQDVDAAAVSVFEVGAQPTLAHEAAPLGYLPGGDVLGFDLKPQTRRASASSWNAQPASSVTAQLARPLPRAADATQ